MSDFIEALLKTEPELFEQPKANPEPTPQGISLQDMKDYFEALKQEMTENMKKEVQNILNAQNTQKDEVPNNVPTAEKEE